MRLLPATHTLRHMLFEIFIVIVGVLIALAVSDWQQQRHDRQVAIQQMQSLLQEVDGNLYSLNNFREHLIPYKLHALETVIATLQGNAPLHIKDVNGFMTTLSSSALTAGMWFKHSSFDALRSSGGFRILGNTALENQLSNTYAGVPVLLDQLKQLEPGYPKLVMQLMPARYQSTLNPLKGYARGPSPAPKVGDVESDQAVVRAIQQHRAQLLARARGEVAVATANWYALTRLRSDFLEVREMLIKQLAAYGDSPPAAKASPQPASAGTR